MWNLELLLIFSPIVMTIALFFVIFKVNTKLKNLNPIETFKIDIQEPYKTFLLSWDKIIEWRLDKWKFNKMRIWDIIQVDDVEFEIWRKQKYSSFKEMLEKEWIQNVLPDKTDIKDWLKNVYYKFYTPEDEKKYWVVAIELKKI
jgi:ASC-1-like (ASCH) protein